MHSSTLLAFSLALGITTAQGIGNDDFPAQCQSSCGPVATRSDQCDNQFDDDDQGQLNCLCNAANMDTLVPECQACLVPFRNNDEYDFNGG